MPSLSGLGSCHKCALPCLQPLPNCWLGIFPPGPSSLGFPKHCVFALPPAGSSQKAEGREWSPGGGGGRGGKVEKW